MTLDLTNDEYLSFSQAPAFVPGRPSICTLHRWRLRGIRGIRLKTVLIGGRRFVTKTALAEFIESTTAATQTLNTNPSIASSRTDRNYCKAAQGLANQGFIVPAKTDQKE